MTFRDDVSNVKFQGLTNERRDSLLRNRGASTPEPVEGAEGVEGN